MTERFTRPKMQEYIARTLATSTEFPEFMDIARWNLYRKRTYVQYPAMILDFKRDSINDTGVQQQTHTAEFDLVYRLSTANRDDAQDRLNSLDERLKEFFDKHPHL